MGVLENDAGIRGGDALYQTMQHCTNVGSIVLKCMRSEMLKGYRGDYSSVVWLMFFRQKVQGSNYK